uniref:Uncharacterized protein n=1 Tax=Alexandrium andersonii TaxID=327968 RepID=A0A7S2I945_9DINO
MAGKAAPRSPWDGFHLKVKNTFLEVEVVAPSVDGAESTTGLRRRASCPSLTTSLEYPWDAAPVSQLPPSAKPLKVRKPSMQGASFTKPVQALSWSLEEDDMSDSMIEAYSPGLIPGTGRNPASWEKTVGQSQKNKGKGRPCKGKRDRYKKLVIRMLSALDVNPNLDITQMELPPSLADNQALRQQLYNKVWGQMTLA